MKYYNRGSLQYSGFNDPEFSEKKKKRFYRMIEGNVSKISMHDYWKNIYTHVRDMCVFEIASILPRICRLQLDNYCSQLSSNTDLSPCNRNREELLEKKKVFFYSIYVRYAELSLFFSFLFFPYM